MTPKEIEQEVEGLFKQYESGFINLLELASALLAFGMEEFHSGKYDRKGLDRT